MLQLPKLLPSTIHYKQKESSISRKKGSWLYLICVISVKYIPKSFFMINKFDSWKYKN